MFSDPKTIPTVANYKQLLDSFFVISIVIKVSVRLSALDIPKTESNNCFITALKGKEMFTTVSGKEHLEVMFLLLD